ncbi:DUF1049 domain-containing protein [bacterium]|nr:DUF1049 domain-containing protein [bacterium]
MQLKLIVILLFSLILVVFTMQNISPVEIKLFGWVSPPLSLMVVILISVLFGGLFATILGLLKQWKLISLLKEKDRKIEALSVRFAELKKDDEEPEE